MPEVSMSEKVRVAGIAGSALSLGGFAAALGLCCSVPWAVALFGVAGAVTFARLAFLMPYALAGAALLLGIGFWLAYRKPACADGECDATSRRTLRWVMWITAVSVGALGIAALTLRVTTI
jgi:hypothetical protein